MASTQFASDSATVDMEQLYAERLNRYTTAMRNEKPDRIPIRPFVAEFTGKYAGYTCQELAHNYENAFAAARKCAADFEWDAVVSNMVYVWTGLAEVIGLKYFGIPGIGCSADLGFQYIEPSEDESFMRADEYDQLIEDPTGFLLNVWLPRVSSHVVPMGETTTRENNLSFLKGGMAMLQYFGAFQKQNELLRTESGTVSAIAGIFKAPLDIIGDKMRGYLGLVDDLFTQPDKVLAACEALMPHLHHVASNTADPDCHVPIGYWMHRGCVPFVTPDTFNNIYWPTVKPIIEELWKEGKQTLFYAEGDWNYHLQSFKQLPDRSIVYHVDQADIFEVHRELGDKFCLSGGIPNVMLGYRPADEVRAHCKKVIDGVAGDGGYIMDASAIVQNDAQIENIKAMTEFTLDYGVYSAGSTSSLIQPPSQGTAKNNLSGDSLLPPCKTKTVPGVCVSWNEERSRLPQIEGDEKIVQNVWEDIDGLANMYVWQLLLSF